MVNIQNFLRAPTQEQREEISLLCEKGQSNSFFGCYVQAPLQAMTSIALALKDIPHAPLKGLYESVTHLTSLSLKNAGTCFLDGIEIGVRSLIQVVVIVSTVTLGILFPSYVYSKLEKLNSNEKGDKFKLKSEEIIEKLKTDLTTKENQILQMQKVSEEIIEKLKTDLSTKENQILEIQKVLDSKIEGTENKKPTQSDLENIKLELKVKSDALNDLQEKFKKLDVEFVDSKLNYEEVLRKLNESLLQVKKEKNDIAEKISRLTEELETEKEQKQNQEKISNDLQVQITKKDESIEYFKNELFDQTKQTKERESFDLQLTLTEKNNEISNLQKQLEVAHHQETRIKGNELEEIKAKHAQVENEVLELKKDLQDKTEKVNHLTKENIEAKEILAQNNDHIANSQRLLQSQEKLKDKNFKKLNQQIADLTEKNTKLKQKLSEFEVKSSDSPEKNILETQNSSDGS